jgi:hypothetical protein
MCFVKSSSTTISTFAYADWAGFAVFFGTKLVSWSARKQATISRSSIEVEYKALANATAKVMWIQTLSKELEIPSPRSDQLWCNNIGATYLTSSHVEYKALANARAKVMWIQTLLKELEIPSPQSDQLWCDNIGAIYLTSSLVFHARTQHIKVGYHFVREKGCSRVSCISIRDRMVDGFTKPLTSRLLNQFKSIFNMSHN